MKSSKLASILWLCVNLTGSPNLAHAEAPNLCVTPILNNPAQMSGLEMRQPYRLVGAHATDVLDDYPGLILNPVNRFGIFTVSNGEYKKVPDEIAFQISKWGAQKRSVQPEFDASMLPNGFTRDDMRAEFYPELGLFLTRNADSVWYRKPDETDWRRYVKASLWNGLKERNMGGSWERPKVWRRDVTGMVVMKLNAHQILVGHQAMVGGDLTFEYQTLSAGSFIDPIYHEETGNLLFWKQDRKLYQLALPRITEVDVPWDLPPVPKGGLDSWNYPRFSESDPKTGDVLFRHFSGLARYDGRRVTNIDHWDTAIVSEFTKMVWLNGKRYAVSPDGVFRLDDDLNLTRINTPLDADEDEDSPQHHRIVELSYSAELDQIFLTRRRDGRIFATIDFTEFHEVRNSTGTKIHRFVSDIPDERAVLLLGSDGLYQAGSCS